MLRTEFQFRCTKHSVNLLGRPRFTVADTDHCTFKVELGSMWCPQGGNNLVGQGDTCRGSWTDRACDHMRSLKEEGPKECHVMTCWNYAGKWFHSNQAV
jgi:hypothetical protein